MIITEFYKMILNNMDLSTISKFQDGILCGGVYLCLLLDVILMIFSILFITSIALSIYIKIKTKRNILYWINLFIDEL